MLDVIALIDASRVSHEPAHVWFAAEGRRGWATCPITENGLMRIIAYPRYPNAVAAPADAVTPLLRLVGVPGHVFWPDDISVHEAASFESDWMAAVGQVTDGCLLGLAVAHGGKLATSGPTPFCARGQRRGDALHLIGATGEIIARADARGGCPAARPKPLGLT